MIARSAFAIVWCWLLWVPSGLAAAAGGRRISSSLRQGGFQSGPAKIARVGPGPGASPGISACCTDAPCGRDGLL
eukprot:CAMPEP_0180823862 /NCGR_PEP_ID=MMETSP1038_2-20121128/72131_1 /TAXON_ID=632150 /ORGANISM="Azadinium spinosum, Strain 3D9" /LENGTH=74 /DNA_ID=CAMNT_0022866221 /DNA_START=65 /DNA_END=285 /DNA_ORIENTATION=+